MIRPATAQDAQAIATLYNHYIQTTCITFEEEPVTAQIIQERMNDVAAQELPWIVAEYEGTLVGYAYAAKFHKRTAYRFAAETTVYLNPQFKGKGFGKLLYEVIIKSLREKNYNVVIGSIALPNANSVGLHESLGFKKAGHFSQIGFKFNQWIDVGYWQLSL